jgi:hypothetical protein
LGASDAQIAVKRDAANNVVFTVEFMKDGSVGEEIVSSLHVVEVGKDDDGDTITSCMVKAVERPAGTTKAIPPVRLTKGARIALGALHDAIGEMGQPSPASNHIPARVKVVTIDQWRDRAFSKGLSTSDQPNARRMAFNRATESLFASHQVGVWDPYVWPASA